MRLGAHLATRRELHARIDDDVQQVADQLHDESEQREEVQRPQHDRIVAAHDRLVAQQPEAVEREQRLDQQRAREERGDERGRKAGDDRDQRVAEDVLVEHAPLATGPWRARPARTACGSPRRTCSWSASSPRRSCRSRSRSAAAPGARSSRAMRAGQDSVAQLSDVSPRSGNQSRNVPPANSTISSTPSAKPGQREADQHEQRGRACRSATLRAPPSRRPSGIEMR